MRNVSSEINSAVGGLKETVDTIQVLKDISNKTDEKLNETKDNMSKGINEASQAIIAEAGQFAENLME